MPDDNTLTDAERRLRAVLRPDGQRVRSLVSRALSTEREIHSVWRRRALVAGVAALLGITGATLWRASAPAPPVLHISGTGSVVVVTSDDGRRWLVDARRDAEARGHYVIAVPPE